MSSPSPPPRRNPNPVWNAYALQVGQQAAQAAGETHVLQVQFHGGARSKVHGALGKFTAFYSGELLVRADGSWEFSGKVQFYDEYDFDTHGNRIQGANWKVEMAQKYMAGTPFAVVSPEFHVRETSDSGEASWIGSGVSETHAAGGD